MGSRREPDAKSHWKKLVFRAYFFCAMTRHERIESPGFFVAFCASDS